MGNTLIKPGTGDVYSLLCCVRCDIRQLFVHSYRVYCMLGDGETAEGSVWEAAAFSSYYQLDNLVAIVDVNR